MDAEFMKKTELIERSKAFREIHSPDDEDSLAEAKRRLKYDELFLMQLGLALRRYKTQHFSPAPAIVCNDEIDSRILISLSQKSLDEEWANAFI